MTNNPSPEERCGRLAVAFRNLPEPVRLFLLADLALWLLALAFESVCRFVLHLPSPYKSPLLFEHFPDLIDLRARFTHLHTLQFFTDTVDPKCMYPAPIVATYSFFYLFSPHDLAFYLCFGVAAFALAGVLATHALIRRGLARNSALLLIGFSFFSSYPLWFTLKQANQEICVWCFVAFGLFCYVQRRNTLAAACFGVAAAMKIFPFVYLALFLSRRRWREPLIAAATAALVTIPSLWLAYPHILESWRLTGIAVSHFRDVVTLRTYPQMGFDHSLFGLFKSLFHHFLSPSSLSHVLTAYLLCAAAGGVVLYLARIRRLPFVNQVLCLSVASVALPPTSFDYTLLHMYAPWLLLLFLSLHQKSTENRPLTVALLGCAILFSPQTEVIFREGSRGGQIKAVTLIVLFVLALRYPLGQLYDAQDVLIN